MFASRTPTRRAAALLALGALAATGCTSTREQFSRIGQDPKLTQIENPNKQKHDQPVDMPMPQAKQQRHHPNSLWRAGAGAFFKDQRAHRTGDILTVDISVNDQASLNNSTEREREASTSMGLTNFFGLGTVLEGLLPGDAQKENLVQAESSSSHSGSGEIERSESINMEIAAVITQVLPNGNLVIQGRQETRINAELRELVITGIVRPQDISPDNTVAYEKIAEARLSYGGRGTISDVQEPRYGQQLYEAVAPF